MASNTVNNRSWKEPAKKIARGAFIVIEGLDRAGKTTQVENLSDELYASGRNIKTMRFPDRTSPIGAMINSYLLSQTEMDDHAIHLLFSANRWEFSNFIATSLTSGYTIICDRYYYSGFIYSAAKSNPTLSLPWAHTPDVGLPRPDLVVFLDLNPEEAEKRGGFGEEKYEKRDMQERVRELFLDLQRMGTGEGDDLLVFDAGGSVESVGREVRERVLERLELVEGGNFGREVRKVEAWREANVERFLEKRMEKGTSYTEQ